MELQHDGHGMEGRVECEGNVAEFCNGYVTQANNASRHLKGSIKSASAANLTSRSVPSHLLLNLTARLIMSYNPVVRQVEFEDAVKPTLIG